MVIFIKKLGKHAGEMGFNTLLLFLTVAIVAIAGAFVIIGETHVFQNKALSNTAEVKANLASNLIIDSITGQDGRNQYLKSMCMNLRLLAGSKELRFKDINAVISTEENTAKLNYISNHTKPYHDIERGFNTFAPQEFNNLQRCDDVVCTTDGSIYVDDNPLVDLDIVDLDNDNLTDKVVVCHTSGGFNYCDPGYDGTHLLIQLSSGKKIYVPFYDKDGNIVNISSAGVNVSDMNISIKSGFNTIGYLYINGTIQIPYSLRGTSTIVYAKHNYLDDDLDQDFKEDYFDVYDDKIVFIFSSGDNVSIPLGITLSSNPNDINLEENISDYGTLLINGTANKANRLDNVIFKIIPNNDLLNTGYYSIYYNYLDHNSRIGAFTHRDKVKLCFELPNKVYSDNHIKITLIPKYGTNLVADFIVKTFKAEKTVKLYPDFED